MVAADGAKGPAATWLGFRNRKRSVSAALEGEFPGPPKHPGKIYLDFGSIPKGYLWNFPKADGQSIGIGVFRGRQASNLRQILDRYAQTFGFTLADCVLEAHPILLWDGDQDLHGPQCLLAGEAACVADPFTAEGIRPSMRSGVLAAEAIHAALQGDDHALPRYSAAIRTEIGQEMRWARRLARLFYAMPATAYQLGVKHPSGPLRMAQILAGEVRYADVAKKGLQRLTLGS